MSSRLLERWRLGGTFSFPEDVGGFSLSTQGASATSSSCDGRRFRSVPRLLDFLGMAMGGVGVAGGYVAVRGGCFSVSGCVASSLFTLRRRLLKGQIGIISCGFRGRVFHVPRGRYAKQAGRRAVAQKRVENDEPSGAQRWQLFTTGDFVTLEKICSQEGG